MLHWNSLLALLLALAGLTAQAETLWVGHFNDAANGIPAPWQIEQIDARFPATRYALRQWDGVPAVEADAKKSMALLARPLTVDLEKTPILCWQWRIDAVVASADMRQKTGDDYAARVYLTFALAPGQLDFSTRAKLALARSVYGDQVPDAAVNYVWDNRQPVGTWQANAYTDRTRMLVLRSGNRLAGAWIRERRNVLADFRQAFGNLRGELRGLAIATDTDNTGEEARAGFADFRFVGAEENCPAPTN